MQDFVTDIDKGGKGTPAIRYSGILQSERDGEEEEGLSEEGVRWGWWVCRKTVKMCSCEKILPV